MLTGKQSENVCPSAEVKKTATYYYQNAIHLMLLYLLLYGGGLACGIMDLISRLLCLKPGYYWGPQFSVDHIILSRAAEFAHFRGISIFLRNFAELVILGHTCRSTLSLD